MKVSKATTLIALCAVSCLVVLPSVTYAQGGGGTTTVSVKPTDTATHTTPGGGTTTISVKPTGASTTTTAAPPSTTGGPVV
ncbi:hypothetical protein BGW39_003657, partial [Mortierella sp. 14UC]